MGDFEKDLRDAFEGVEFTPSEQVWAGVEQGLRPKKKGIFFMWQTYGIAATLVFLLTMGYLFRDELLGSGANDPAKQELTQNDDSPSEGEGQAKTAQTQEENEASPDEPASDTATDPQTLKEATPGLKDLQASNEKANETSGDENRPDVQSSMAAATMTFESVQASVQTEDQTTEQSALNEIESVAEALLINTEFMGPLSLAEPRESIVATRHRWELANMIEPIEIESAEDELPEETSSQRQKSLNGSIGSSSFNPNSSLDNAAVANEEAAFSDPRFADQLSATSSDERQLGSISVGFGVGLPLGERWVLRTGLRYSQYRFASTGTAYSEEDGQQLPIYTRVAFDNSNVTYAGQYELTNTLHSLSVPAQFGWRFLKLGKFSSWLNMGVAADYIVSHTVKGDLNFLETRKVDLSESDFINRLNLNALTGMEFTYELNPKLALSGEVYFRQYIPFGGGEGAYGATPSVLGFGLGVNYYLRRKE